MKRVFEQGSLATSVKAFPSYALTLIPQNVIVSHSQPSKQLEDANHLFLWQFEVLERLFDDGGPSSLKNGMICPSNPSAWKKARHEGLVCT